MKTHLVLLLAALVLLPGCAGKSCSGPGQVAGEGGLVPVAANSTEIPAQEAGRLEYINPFDGPPPAAHLVSTPAGCALEAAGFVVVGLYDLAVFFSRLVLVQ